MAAIREACSVCRAEFDVQFRYQMEERDGGFSFYCSQRCLERSQLAGADDGSKAATCDACAKRFQPDLVSQVLYVGGRRRYACSGGCRTQLLREANGVRLGEIAAPPQGRAEDAPAPSGRARRIEEAPASVRARRVECVRTVEASGQPQVALQTTAAPRAATPSGEQGVRAIEPGTAPDFRISLSLMDGAGPEGDSGATGRGPNGAAVVVPVMPSRRGASAGASDGGSGQESRAGAGAKAQGGMPKYLAVFNHKGGTGKTTTAVSVAAGLASRGKRVLLVDTDAQGNVSVSLGANSERSLYHVLVMGLRVADATRPVRPNLDLLPSNETLAAAELYLAGRQNRDRVLCDRLASAAVAYDFVVLDCSPSLSLMNQNALVFADSVLVPVACDYLSLVGVRQVIKTVKNVNSLLHHPVQIWGVLPTFFDARAKIAREAVSTLKSHFGERCLAPIRSAIKVKEAPAQGQTIFEYAAGTPAAEDYAVVVERILQSRQAAAPSAQAASEAPSAAAAGA